MDVREGDFAQERKRGGEIGLGFARETRNHVSAKGEMWTDPAARFRA